MLEIYKDDAAIQAHQDSQHFKDFRPVVGDLIADRKIEILNMVSDGKTKRG
jgi:quinol monooxygenase YgiN